MCPGNKANETSELLTVVGKLNEGFLFSENTVLVVLIA